MTTLIGSPTLLPDDISLDVNTSTGKLQIKAGDQGDLLYYTGSEWSVLSPGNAGRLLRTNGPGADPDWVDPIGGWTLIEDTASPGSSWTTAALNVYKWYLVEIDADPDSAASLQIQINGIGSGYSYQTLDGATGAYTTGAAQAVITGTLSATVDKACVVLIIGGTSAPNASGRTSILAAGIQKPNAGTSFLGGSVAAGNAVQTSTITVKVSAGSLAGTIKVYGKD